MSKTIHCALMMMMPLLCHAYNVVDITQVFGTHKPFIYDCYELVQTIPLDSTSSVRLAAPTRTEVGYPMFSILSGQMWNNTRIGLFDEQWNIVDTLTGYIDHKLWWTGDSYEKTPWDDYSDQGYKIVLSDCGQYLWWVDEAGNVLNRMPRSLHYYDSFSFANGQYWVIEEQPFMDIRGDCDDDPYPPNFFPKNGFLVDSYFPSCYGILVTDATGHLLFRRELRGGCDLIKPGPRGGVLCINDNLIIDMSNKVLWQNESYGPITISPSEDVAFIGKPSNLVIDLATGDTLAVIKGGSSDFITSIAIADKDIGVLCTFRGDKLLIIDYRLGSILQIIKPAGWLVQFSGDGRRFTMINRKQGFCVWQRKY